MCSYVLQQFSEPLFIHLHWKNFNWSHQICDTVCIGDEIVYRMSMAMTIFFITMTLLGKTNNFLFKSFNKILSFPVNITKKIV